MPQIGSGVPLAHPAATIWVQRGLVTRVPSLFDGDLAFRGKQQPVPCGSRGQDTIHHVNAQIGVFDDFLWGADPHEVPRLVGGQVFKRGLDDFPRQGSRLTDAEAADGVTGKADFNGSLGGFLSQLTVHPTLHDAKKSLRGAGALARVVPIMLPSPGDLPPARPDGGVRA